MPGTLQKSATSNQQNDHGQLYGSAINLSVSLMILLGRAAISTVVLLGATCWCNQPDDEPCVKKLPSCCMCSADLIELTVVVRISSRRILWWGR